MLLGFGVQVFVDDAVLVPDGRGLGVIIIKVSFCLLRLRKILIQ